uniref:Type II toxin-antitoxin system HicA family toxin n=1 Tax=Heterorhabditis bacteriophora TaxID=37862 RepID=A0A1I7WL43_HETBA
MRIYKHSNRKKIIVVVKPSNGFTISHNGVIFPQNTSSVIAREILNYR